MPIIFDHNVLTRYSVGTEDSEPSYKKEKRKYNCKYSNMELLEQFKSEVNRLEGMIPTHKEIENAHIDGRTASPGTFVSRFGNWQKLFTQYKEHNKKNKVAV